MKQKIAIFLSGSGSNARALCHYFDRHPAVEVALLLSNKSDSGAKSIGEAFGIPVFIFNRTQFYQENTVLEQLEQVFFAIDRVLDSPVPFTGPAGG